jgi:hypothetical protein
MKAPFGQARAKSIGETIGLSGLTAPATAEFGVQVDSVTIDSSQAPTWAAKLTPASLDFRSEVQRAAGSIERLRSPSTIHLSPSTAICRLMRKRRSMRRFSPATRN